jgi:hypothetical protein
MVPILEKIQDKQYVNAADVTKAAGLVQWWWRWYAEVYLSAETSSNSNIPVLSIYAHNIFSENIFNRLNI